MTRRTKYLGIPKGWESLIPQIKEIIGDENVIQAKEKFGQLTIYHTLDEDDIDLKWKLRGIKQHASMLCMRDGEPASHLNKRGWIGPLCINCVIDDLVEAGEVKRT